MKKKIIIAIVVLLLVAAATWFYYNFVKPKISVEVADWLNKGLEYKITAGGKTINGTKAYADNNFKTGKLGSDYTFMVESIPNAILISILKSNNKVKVTLVDFKAQEIKDVTSQYVQ